MKTRSVIALVLILCAAFVLAECPTSDLSGDCEVTFEDYSIMASEWLAEGIDGIEVVYPLQSTVEGDQAIHLNLEGLNQGQITGSSTIPGRGTIAVNSYKHNIAIPIDPATGLPTGRRVHGSLTISKYIDKSSPLLIQALIQGELMKTFELGFYRILSSGEIEKYYVITLQNAMVLSYSTESPNAETFSFSYDRIIWDWLPDGISTQDDNRL